MPSFKLSDLDKLPSNSVFQSHSWADYFELLCLVDPDRVKSKADVLDRVFEREDLGESDVIIVDQNQMHPAEKNDKKQQWVDDVFRHLLFRVGVFKEFYPFKVSEEGSTLIRKRKIIDKAKLYLYFLIASNLRYIKPGFRNKVTSSFEIVSSIALKNYLPSNAKVYVFGKNTLNRGKFSGRLWDKILLLAKELNEQVIIQEEKFHPRDTGDNGLDIVSWLPIKDNEKGILIAFGQCACTEEWVKKQHSSSFEAWNQVMTFKVPPNNIAFIPFCFRSSDGSWFRPQDIHSTILVDRLRLVLFLQDSIDLLTMVPYDFIDQTLKQVEPVF